MLSLTEVSFRYNKRTVLNNVSARVNSGDCLAIVGESGSGKSTLLKLIFGQMDVDGGSITWNDKPILGPKNKLVVGHDFMKYVAQEFDLMPYTSVSENIGDHLSNFYPEEKKERVTELIKVVELEGFEHTKVQFLSGGQKQRISIARAIIKEPKILIFDDCLSAVDTATEEVILSNLKVIMKDKTSVIISHRVSSIKHADKIIVLDQGQVIEAGTHEQLIDTKGAYFELYQKQLLEEAEA